VYTIGAYKINSKHTCNMYISATGTREDPIQLETFLDSLNVVIHEYNSPYKDLDASVRIVKPPPIVG
jgi:hypothetical protein